MITMYPTMFEAVDKTGDTVFHIKCFDEHVSTVAINYAMDVETWDRVTEMVRAALMAIHVEKNG